MRELNLTATTPSEQIIKTYLENNVSEILADKINNGSPALKDGVSLTNKKNLDGFMKFASQEARKLADKNATSACVEDNTVFGWAIHYFEEDTIEGTLYNSDGTEYKPKIVNKSTYTPTSVNIPKQQPKPQMSLFDMMTSDSTDNKSEENVEEADETEEEISEPTVVQEPKKAVSPIYTRYMEIQNKYPDSVVAVRLGDFYEVFGQNAVTIAKELDLTLTGRDCGLESRVPMIGFPYHSAEIYFNKIAANRSIAIDENGKISYRNKVKSPDNRAIDEETGEILSEKEMREFDGDIDDAIKEEPVGSPFYQKYMAIQKQYSDSVIAYKRTDFYEILGKNAVTVAKELDLNLVSRDCGLEYKVPMAVIPCDEADSLIGELIQISSVTLVEADGKHTFIEKANTDVDSEKELAKAYDKTVLCKISELLGDTFILG